MSWIVLLLIPDFSHRYLKQSAIAPKWIFPFSPENTNSLKYPYLSSCFFTSFNIRFISSVNGNSLSFPVFVLAIYVAHRGSDDVLAVDIAPTKVIKIETIDNNNTAIYLDVKNKDFISTVEFDSDESKYLVNTIWYSGTTDNVIGKHDGSMISNTNGKYPYRVQGREYSVGGYMIASNTVMIFKSDYSKDVYVAPKGVKHTITEVDIKKNYTLIGNIPVNSNEGKYDYWVGDIDIKNGVWYPCSQGSGNSQGFADFVYAGGNNTFGTREYVQGGCLFDASNAGFTCLSCGGRLDYVYLNYCAAD